MDNKGNEMVWSDKFTELLVALDDVAIQVHEGLALARIIPQVDEKEYNRIHHKMSEKDATEAICRSIGLYGEYDVNGEPYRVHSTRTLARMYKHQDLMIKKYE